MIYVMRQGARVDKLTMCYRKRKKQIDASFSFVSPVIENEFRQDPISCTAFITIVL